MGRPKYFTPKEVAVHNTVDDLWVSFLGKVYNLTPLCEKYKGIFFFITRVKTQESRSSSSSSSSISVHDSSGTFPHN